MSMKWLSIVEAIFERTKRKDIEVDWPWLGGFLFFCFVTGTMIYSASQLTDWAENAERVPITTALISGNEQFVDADDVKRAIFATSPGSFFTVDVDNIQQRVKTLPWVYEVSVRKQWPDILKIHIQEQQPIAFWNDEQLLNVHGDVFTAPLAKVKQPLPELHGPEGSEADALKGFNDLNDLLMFSDMKITQLALSERFAWQLKLENGIRLDIGREDKVKRVQQFIYMYSTISSYKQEQIDYVDLRYDTGLAVAWKSEGKEQKS